MTIRGFYILNGVRVPVEAETVPEFIRQVSKGLTWCVDLIVREPETDKRKGDNEESIVVVDLGGGDYST